MVISFSDTIGRPFTSICIALRAGVKAILTYPVLRPKGKTSAVEVTTKAPGRCLINITERFNRIFFQKVDVEIREQCHDP